MFILKKDNVERIVIDESARDKLIKDGYQILEIGKKESDNSKLTVEQLKEIATEKGIEFNSNIKKADLIELIESAEDGE